MKTVIVVYTDSKSLTKAQIGQFKRYSFNTSAELKEGDIIKSPQYDTNMYVVKVLDTSYKYYNRSTGELSDEYTSTSQWEIRNLVIQESAETDVFGTLVK